MVWKDHEMVTKNGGKKILKLNRCSVVLKNEKTVNSGKLNARFETLRKVSNLAFNQSIQGFNYWPLMEVSRNDWLLNECAVYQPVIHPRHFPSFLL
jgi:hypothetical protein